MPKRAIAPDGVPAGQYTPVVESEGLVFLSGQVPFDENGSLIAGDFSTQAHQAFENMRRCLAAAGCEFSDVVKVTTFLADFGDASEYGQIYAEYFTEPYPARSTVQAGLAGFKIEIEAVARIPTPRSPS